VTFTVKNVKKRYESLPPSKTNARKVLSPPLNTAEPIITSVLMALSETSLT
jgi:hypothetical protein